MAKIVLLWAIGRKKVKMRADRIMVCNGNLWREESDQNENVVKKWMDLFLESPAG